MYATAGAICVVGISYAAVPLYQIFCQATGYGGTTQQASEEKFKNMKPVPGARQLTVHFNADTSSSMPWTFVPQQRVVKVVPGETALAFYTAHNPTDAPVTGVSTYNVTPMRAGLYFNKIQCFCFEEQRLRPHEEIDMPVRAGLRSCCVA
jgi:cytochrome c oxidase assembly protein subunit 11